MWGQSLTELFLKGGPIMWPLLGCSVLSLTVILERSCVFTRLHSRFRPFANILQQKLKTEPLVNCVFTLEQQQKPLPQVAACWLSHREQSTERDAIVARECSQQLARLERRLNWLSIIARISPLLGLLGTVSGLVTAFYQIELNAGRAAPDDFAGGIWAALLTTVYGLSIALPTLVAYHAFEHRVSQVELQMQWLTSYLTEWTADRSVNTPSADAKTS